MVTAKTHDADDDGRVHVLPDLGIKYFSSLLMTATLRPYLSVYLLAKRCPCFPFLRIRQIRGHSYM